MDGQDHDGSASSLILDPSHLTAWASTNVLGVLIYRRVVGQAVLDEVSPSRQFMLMESMVDSSEGISWLVVELSCASLL